VLEYLRSNPGLKGLILDLRFNPGGFLASAVEISDLLIDDGIIVTIKPRKGRPTTYEGDHEGSLLDFPIVCNVQLTIPDQAKVLKGYNSRLRKMQAAQSDANGGRRINVEAQVAEAQLVRVQQDIISSSVKTAKLSLVIGTRTSQRAVTTADLEQAERTLDNRRQQLLYAIARMNGAKAVAETLAKRRLFFCSLPSMADADKRDQDLLTSNAADLVPVEMPWRGTPRSPLFLLETPYRQLIPFSLFDPGLSDANMLVMAKTGGGKTVMVQQFLLMAARSTPLISILERGDSYRPLVELMGGRMITNASTALHQVDLALTELVIADDLEMTARCDATLRRCVTPARGREIRPRGFPPARRPDP